MMAHDVGKAMEKGVVTFPYRGLLVKSRICWESVPQDTLEALSQLVRAGLVVEHPETFTLTEAGWLYYVNLMYFLMPGNAKLWLSGEVSARISAGHDCEATELL